MVEKWFKKFGYVKVKLSSRDSLVIDVEVNTDAAVNSFANLEAALERVAQKAGNLLSSGSSITYKKTAKTETITIKANDGTTSN